MTPSVTAVVNNAAPSPPTARIAKSENEGGVGVEDDGKTTVLPVDFSCLREFRSMGKGAGPL